MEQDAKNLMQSAKSNKNGKKVAENFAKLKAFAASPEGKRMISAIGERGAGMTAAAAKGDPQSIKELLTFLTTTAEGRALAGKILEMTKTDEK